uniref:Uncharacterized protein n=1 Tax=Panagrolaimus sp. JU765 TaxID=591449 RepID=A0AC34QFS9_9BILA
MFKKSKSQSKIIPQGLANRIPPETEASKEKDPPRPGSAISRDFVPKKQQKVIQNWKKNNSEDSTSTNQSTNQQAVNTPFGFVPFKSAPLPIYGNRMNPNGENPAKQGNPVYGTKMNPNGTQPTTQAAIANYMQNAYQQSPQLQRPDSVLTATDMNSRPGSELGMFRLPSRYQSYTTLPRPEQLPIDTQPIQQPIYGTMLPKVAINHNRTASIDRNSIYGTTEKRPLSQISGSKSLHTIHTEPCLPRVGSKAALSFYGVPYPDEDPYGPKSAITYQQSPQLQRPDSVLTATDMNSRPGSELGMFRLPSRYQSYTTLPRPEQLPVDTQPIQQPIYGTMLPKVAINHNRTASIDRNSIYGTTEKRPLSQISGSKSLHTIHTEPCLPRVGSKAALSFYGVPYPDEDPYGPKSAISWDSLNLLGALQILFGILILVVSGLRLFESPSNSHVYEIGFSILLVTNGLISCLSAFQHNYSLFVITLVFSTINLLLSSFPIYSGSEPFFNIPEQKIITAFDAIKTQQTSPSNQLKFCLLVTSLVAALACLGNVLICCKSMGKLLFHVETLRLQNDLNKKSKEFIVQP